MNNSEKVKSQLQTVVAFGLLVDECAKRGIGRTTAFRLSREKLVEVFTIGRRRYVKLASLDSLPERLAAIGDDNEG